MQLVDMSFVRESFTNVLNLTLNIAKARTIVKNIYGSDISFEEICNQHLTFKIKFPRQIGKTNYLLKECSEFSTPSEGFYLINTALPINEVNKGHNSVYSNATFYLTSKEAVDIVKNNVYNNPNLGYVFIIDSCSELKQNTLKLVIIEVFQEYNKGKSDLEKIYPSFVIIE